MALACATRAVSRGSEANDDPEGDSAAEQGAWDGDPSDPNGDKKKPRNKTLPENKGKGRLFGRDWRPEEDRLLLHALSEFYVPEDGVAKRPWKAIHAKYFGEGSPYPRGIDEMRNRERRIREAASKPFDPLNPPSRCGRVGCNLPKKGHICLNPLGRWMTKEERKRASSEANALLRAQAETIEGDWLLSTNGPESGAAAAAGLRAAGLPVGDGSRSAKPDEGFDSYSAVYGCGASGASGGGGAGPSMHAAAQEASMHAAACDLGAVARHLQDVGDGDDDGGDDDGPAACTSVNDAIADDRAAARAALMAFAKAFAEAEATRTARRGDDSPPPETLSTSQLPSSATSSIAGDSTDHGGGLSPEGGLSPRGETALPSPEGAAPPPPSEAPLPPPAVPPPPPVAVASSPQAAAPALAAETYARPPPSASGANEQQAEKQQAEKQQAEKQQAEEAPGAALKRPRSTDGVEGAPSTDTAVYDADNGLTPPSRRPWRGGGFEAGEAPRLTLDAFPPGTLVFTPSKTVSGGGSFCPVLQHDAGQLRVAAPEGESALVSLDFLTSRQEQGLPIHS